MYRKQLTKEQAFQKLKHYCAYQERCHSEVKEKLYSFGLRKTEVEQLLSQLIDEDYLNEERFAVQFAGGKFRMKQWGRIKIKYELKQKQVSPYCIKKAEKLKTLRSETNHFIRKRKLQDYLLQKGYEPELIQPLLRNEH
jgi:regulatory protein